jgi:hypothetical protein
LLNDNTLEEVTPSSFAMAEERFYVIVPETVQSDMTSHDMESGRLMAQSFHIGRVVEYRRAMAGAQSQDITTIVLAVRNTLELNKVMTELVGQQLVDDGKGKPHFAVSLYRDHNPQVYQTDSRVLTALCVGPVIRSAVEHILGHLETY